MFGTFPGIGGFANRSEHPTFGPAVGASSLPYVVGPRGYDGGIHNSPFTDGKPKEPFTAPGPYNPYRFARPWKRRVNLLSIVQVLSLLLLIFAFTTYLFGFSVHYTAPIWCTFWLGFCMVLAFVFLIKGFMILRKQRQEVLTVLWYMRDDDETWLMFLGISVIVCVLLGVVIGNIIYSGYSQPYYTLSQLHSYKEVDPLAEGKAYLDTGALTFRKNSYVDISHGIGYKDGAVYCAAPVVFGNESVTNFDFWAVGVGCCNGFPGDFNCFEKQRVADLSSGGLRVIDDATIPRYKLAVQLAKAEWGKNSPNPIFLTYMPDPVKKINSYWSDATTTYAVCIVCFVIFEFLIVGLASVFYWRRKMWG